MKSCDEIRNKPAAEAQKEAMAKLKASIQSNPRPTTTLVNPNREPRYDAIYQAGVAMLNKS